MTDLFIPLIEYNTFAPTRNSIQIFAQLISEIKGRFFPHQKNWEEFGLRLCANGLTTTPIPVETSEGMEFLEFNINLKEHKLDVNFKSQPREFTLKKKTYNDFTEELLTNLKSLDLDPGKIDGKFFSSDILVYKPAEAAKLWRLLIEIQFILLEFRGSSLYETSNVNFWAHHFDLSLLVFSGQLIDGQDPADWDYSREQMNFGFSFGDTAIKYPYFYITMYPFKDSILSEKLPDFAYWHTGGWKGVVVELNKLSNLKDNKSLLLKLFNDLLGYNFNNK